MAKQKSVVATLREVFKSRDLPLEQETCWFILVSALDFWLTYLLLIHPERLFVESNPVAYFFLRYWGLKGLLLFKLAVVAFVAVLCQIIARHKPRTARSILLGGILVVGIVVVYSAKLLWLSGGGPPLLD